MTKKQRMGESACPISALYWDSYQRNADKLKNNLRLGMAYQPLPRMKFFELAQLRAWAIHLCQHLDTR